MAVSDLLGLLRCESAQLRFVYTDEDKVSKVVEIDPAHILQMVLTENADFVGKTELEIVVLLDLSTVSCTTYSNDLTVRVADTALIDQARKPALKGD